MSECLHTKLARLNRLVASDFNLEMHQHGITIQQFVILNHLKKYQPNSLCAVHLGVVFQIEKSTLSRNLKRLIAKNLIVIGPPAGRRGRDIALTEKGEELVRVATPTWTLVQERLLQKLRKRGVPFFALLDDAEHALLAV